MDEPTPDALGSDVSELHRSRLQLVRDTVVFQFKLAADGIRDIILSPVSIIATVMGLVSGGDEPDKYFRRVQRLGRRTEIWINLFGRYQHGDTSDKLFEPFEARLKDEYARGGWVTRSANQMNTLLDSLNKANSPERSATARVDSPERSATARVDSPERSATARDGDSTEPQPPTSVRDDPKSP